MHKFKGAVVRFARDEEAATAAEYGLIAALIAGVVIVGVRALGGSLQGMFTKLSNSVQGATPN